MWIGEKTAEVQRWQIPGKSGRRVDFERFGIFSATEDTEIF